jgi:spore maturation protein CgeB
MRILAVGPMWRGSNAGGLFKAMNREGCLIEIVDEFYYISLRSVKKTTKIAERLIRGLQLDEFNHAIREAVIKFQPRILLVYKGAFVYPETIEFAKQSGARAVMFYPDVSMAAHGSLIVKDIPLYELIFTTKTFGITDLEKQFNFHKSFFIPHGFDPEIHRKLKIGTEEEAIFGCDASFIGTWSPKKEKILSELVRQIPGLVLKIWGGQWNRATDPILKDSIQHKPVLGDLYALAIQCSKINLGILSEQVRGASSGDLITSRTFHIPGSSGFMIHEKTDEIELYYEEDKEAAFFSDAQDLVNKVHYYLKNPELRAMVQQRGYERALRDHSLDNRARTILAILDQNLKY